MRILAFFIHSSEYGKIIRGSERRFLEISKHLRDLGVDVYALEYAPSLAEMWNTYSYHPLKVKRRFKNHSLLSMLYLVLYGVIFCIKYKCDIIYLPNHRPCGFSPYESVVPAYIVSRLCRKPLVIVFHHLLYVDASERNPFQSLAYRQAEVCIAVSQATANDIKKHFKIKRVVINGNGVDLNQFKAFRSKAKLYDAVYLGRISESKGIYTLIKAWKIVTNKLPSAQLLIVGGSEKNVDGSVRALLRELKLERNVILTGFVSDDEKIQLLKLSRLFIFPSNAEGFGMAVVEAMACGLPCIISDVPALKENFDQTAIFVKPGDTEGFSDAVLGLLFDPNRYNKLKSQTQRFIERFASEFTWKKVARKEIEICTRIINKIGSQ